MKTPPNQAKFDQAAFALDAVADPDAGMLLDDAAKRQRFGKSRFRGGWKSAPEYIRRPHENDNRR